VHDALPMFVNSTGMYADPAAAPPGPTPSQTSRAELRHLDVVVEALPEVCVPVPPVELPPEPADAFGVDEENEPTIRATPAASATTATAPINRLLFTPSPRRVERIPCSHATTGTSRTDVRHVTVR